jgi:hypothetical protein
MEMKLEEFSKINMAESEISAQSIEETIKTLSNEFELKEIKFIVMKKDG